MKKFLILSIFIFYAIFAVGQSGNYKEGDFTGKTIKANKLQLGDGANKIVLGSTGEGSDTGYVHTTEAQNIYGVKTFRSVPIIQIGSVTASNIAVGKKALPAITTGYRNIVFGDSAAVLLTTGHDNISIGHKALNFSTLNTSSNIAIGHYSMMLSTTNLNVAIGNYSQPVCLNSIHNTSVGSYSLFVNSDGNYNSALGEYALGSVITGSYNVGIGYGTLYHDYSGAGSSVRAQSYNVAVGYKALDLDTAGSNNVAIGANSLHGVLSGSDNIAIGDNSGPAGTTSTLSNKLYISNKVGGADTAIIYGTMGATISASSLQFNANVDISGSLEGSSLIRGSASFSAALTRVAVYIPGATTVDYYTVQPVGADQYTRPVAGDLLMTYAKTDSLIVTRQAGTTANLAFDWFRVK